MYREHFRRKGGILLQIGIQEELLQLHYNVGNTSLLDRLLQDRTTKGRIIWGTDAYADRGPAYQRDREIAAALITGENSGVIKNRARKALEQQSQRTHRHGEVFTPLWICEKMNDFADEVWFGKPDRFRKDGAPTERVQFTAKKHWRLYVNARRLEITCGEAPYLASRYDVSTGEYIPIRDRIGILDRKLRVVNENTDNEKDWFEWVQRAYWATYGYEFQGDNLLIARLNLLMTFEEYMVDRWHRKPNTREYQKIVDIITWNLWQMDGLTGAIPYQLDAEYQEPMWGYYDPPGAEAPVFCRVRNWRHLDRLEFRNCSKGEKRMKFDFVIGNARDILGLNAEIV